MPLDIEIPNHSDKSGEQRERKKERNEAPDNGRLSIVGN